MAGNAGQDTDQDVLPERRLRLVSELRIAWQRGWQPLDVHRHVSKYLGRRHLGVLCAAIADEIRGYPVETVDRRWRGQLVEIDALPDSLSAARRLRRIELAEGGRSLLSRLTLEVLLLVRSLPAVQLLIPPPGSATAGVRPAVEGDTEVDERILRRVRALLAKAESTQYAEEADTYTTAAQRLMTRHRIDAAMLAATSTGRRFDPQARRIGIESPYEAAKVMLLGSVADANGCTTVWSKGLGFSTVVGAAADLEVVEHLFTSLLLQAAAAMQRTGSEAGAGARARSRSFKRSFLTAYAIRIGERLAEASDSEVSAATARVGGNDLVPVLAARAAAVDQAVETLFGRLRRSTSSSSIDPDGWASGRGAADRARLGSDRTPRLTRPA